LDQTEQTRLTTDVANASTPLSLAQRVEAKENTAEAAIPTSGKVLAGGLKPDAWINRRDQPLSNYCLPVVLPQILADQKFREYIKEAQANPWIPRFLSVKKVSKAKTTTVALQDFMEKLGDLLEASMFKFDGQYGTPAGRARWYQIVHQLIRKMCQIDGLHEAVRNYDDVKARTFAINHLGFGKLFSRLEHLAAKAGPWNILFLGKDLSPQFALEAERLHHIMKSLTHWVCNYHKSTCIPRDDPAKSIDWQKNWHYCRRFNRGGRLAMMAFRTTEERDLNQFSPTDLEWCKPIMIKTDEPVP